MTQLAFFYSKKTIPNVIREYFKLEQLPWHLEEVEK
jgi:hypothetical protein